MSHQRILSSRFNMSLGFIPVIISIILCEFITQDMSIYIGAGVGLLFSIYSVRHRGTHVTAIIGNNPSPRKLLSPFHASVHAGNQRHHPPVHHLPQ